MILSFRTTKAKEVTILIIDDEAEFLAGLAAVLRDDGHVVQECARPCELPPLDTLGEVSLVIIDHDVKKRDGLAFADSFHQAHPSTPIVVLTAYWSLRLAGEVAARSSIHLRRKPITKDELRTLVRHLGVQFASSRSERRGEFLNGGDAQ